MQAAAESEKPPWWEVTPPTLDLGPLANDSAPAAVLPVGDTTAPLPTAAVAPITSPNTGGDDHFSSIDPRLPALEWYLGQTDGHKPNSELIGNIADRLHAHPSYDHPPPRVSKWLFTSGFRLHQQHMLYLFGEPLDPT